MFTNLDFRPSETVVVVGNGAISNGWQPVRTAFKRADNLESLIIDPAEPFSYLVYQLRVLARKAEHDDSINGMFRRRFEFLNRLRREIGRAFEEARTKGEISLRVPGNPEFHEFFDKNRCSLITTNWDTLLHERFGDFPILSLHGWVKDPDTLYLPTEITFEPYRRFEDESARKLSEAHRVAIELLKSARRVVLWGISLNMYDAEICVLLADSHSPGKEYVIVDPCLQPGKRLLFLTGEKKLRQIRPDGAICRKSCCRDAALKPDEA